MSKIRQTPFEKALHAAERRLQAALLERESAQSRLAALNAEIPALQQTISALQRQLEPKPKPANFEPLPDIKLDMPVDLSGMGSTRTLQSEDDLLPDVEGEPVVPE